MAYETSIDLSCSYWDEEGFRSDMERVRKLLVELLANVGNDYEISPRELGYVLRIFDLLDDEKFVDCRKQQ